MKSVQTPPISNSYEPDAQIILRSGPCSEALAEVPDGVVNLIVTSPPYNMGKSYEVAVTLEAYARALEETLSELVRVLAPNGSICWQIGNYVKDGELFPLDYIYYRLFSDLGLKLRSRIIWHFEHGLNPSRRFSGRYEVILWLTKGDDYVFNLDAVRVPAKYPGKRSYKGPNKGKPSCNPLGKNPGDVWKVIHEDWENQIWVVPNVKANHVEKTAHPCQFPIEIAERCIVALSSENDLILDPFCGSGSALLAALKNGRRAMGCEKEAAYIAITNERIIRLFQNDLPYRPLGKQIEHAKGKVALHPPEWASL